MPSPLPADVARLWEVGRLRYKLREHQETLHAFISDWRGDEARKVVKCARRFGKSFGLCLYATEFALRNPGCQIRFAAPTEKALRKIVRPNMRVILSDCPEHLRPRWNTQDSCYVFPNGSEWHLAGTDKDNVEKLRGTGTDLAIIDEAGFHDDLEYVVDDVLTPQLLDNGGRLVMISTPPRSPAHPFAARFCPEAAAEESLFVRTIRDNTHLKPHEVERYVKALGGWDSLATRRELLCEDVIDEESAVVPEFNAHEAAIVQEPQVPTHFYPLVAMDVGFADWHAILFGFWDFLAAKLVVQDEVFLRRARTDEIAAAILAKEAELWPWAARELKRDDASGLYDFEPWRTDRLATLRFSDVDLRLIRDLDEIHGLKFAPTAKDDREAQINELRMFVKAERIVIAPRCKMLIRHLKTATWNKARTDFERTKADGHFDGVPAIVYKLRNAPRAKNPFPPKVHGPDVMVRNKAEAMSATARTLISAFGGDDA